VPVVTVVPLAAVERLSAAFSRYDAAWTSQDEGLVAARIELCEALLDCGEVLPVEVLAQLARDRAELAQHPVLAERVVSEV
jgi:hypothetical protein